MTQFAKGNKARPERPAETHGGAAAAQQLTRGQEFTSPLALAKQADVVAELETGGLEAVVESRVARLQTVADLYFDAITAAAQQGDINAVVKYTEKYGWIQATALRGWAQVKADRKKGNPKLTEVLSDYSSK